jgi:hypothetical protein
MGNIYNGEWYLPEKQTILPGKLVIDKDEKSIILHLYCENFLNGDKIEIKGRKINNHEMILGDVHQIISLYHCRFMRLQRIGNSLYKLSYRIEYIFFNIHLPKISDLLILKAEINFPFLSSFFDGYSSFKDENQNIEDSLITYSNPMKISESLEILLIDEYNKNFKKFDGNYEVKYSKLIQFSYNNEQSFHDLLKSIFTFSTLLAFVTKKPINYKLEKLKIKLGNIDSYDNHYNVVNGVYPVYIVNFSLNSLHKVFDNDLHQNDMMFSKWQFSDEELNNFIKNWYENSHLSTIYDFYIDSNNWFEGKSVTLSNVMYNNKFLNLAQALESYFDNLNIEILTTNEEFTKKRQIALNFITDNELKKWVNKNLKYPKSTNYADKLEFLVDKFNDIFEENEVLKNFSKEYPIIAKDYRHKLSHGRIEKTYQGEDFDKIFSFSKILMCFCILESLKMNKIEIKRICKSNFYLYKQIRAVISP